MNEHSEDHDLIDKHLAGILTPEEEARLESLIRTEPESARRYQEAERMAALLRDAIGRDPAPEEVKRQIRARVAARAIQSPPPPARRRHVRPWLVAACVLVALAGVYLFLSHEGRPFMPVAYTQEPLPLKDLARSSDVLLLGRSESVDGRVRFRPDTTIYGDTTGRACALPASVEGGLAIALFGRYEGDDLIEVVGGDRGIVHLDGLQRWEGHSLPPERVRKLLQRAPEERTVESALADLWRFLDSDATRSGVDPSADLVYAAPVTARYLGRFGIDQIGVPLMSLVLSRDKHPDARGAGAEALVAADPLGTCRKLLAHVLSGPVEMLHGESEDGLVVLHCLELIQASGSADLDADLRRLAERVHCPSLRRAATAAADAVVGTGTRKPGARRSPQPVRLTVDGREGVCVPGCQGKARGLLVVFRGSAALRDLSALTNVALGHGHAVLLLPEGARDLTHWLRAAADTGFEQGGEAHYVGLVGGCEDAVRAARLQRPARLVLLKPPPGLAQRVIQDLPAVELDVFSPARDLDVEWGDKRRLHGIQPFELPRLLAQPSLLKGLVRAD